VNAHSLVTPQNYALVISGQFSGFNYNETSAELLPVIGVCVRKTRRERLHVYSNQDRKSAKLTSHYAHTHHHSWDSFVDALNGSTAGAVLLVLVLIVLGMGLIGCCFRPPRCVSVIPFVCICKHLTNQRNANSTHTASRCRWAAAGPPMGKGAPLTRACPCQVPAW
jgi:hypothetical protein